MLEGLVVAMLIDEEQGHGEDQHARMCRKQFLETAELVNAMMSEAKR